MVRSIRCQATIQRRGFSLAFIATAVLLAACGASSNKTASNAGSTPQTGASNAGAPSGTPIKIGVLDDITGPFSVDGANLRLNVDLAVSQINGSGGINGHPLQATFVDPRGDPAESLTLAQQLVQQDGVDILFGAIGSPECLGVQGLAPKLGVVYMTANGCANEQFTSQSCNKYSFRVNAAGQQTTDPLAQYMVKNYGQRWAILYQDYAFGQSQLQAFTASLTKAGGSITVKIPFPLGEANLITYVSKIPTDGSVNGIIAYEGGDDQAHVLSAMDQFGISKKLPIVAAVFKEFYAGIYPASLNGAVGTTVNLSEAPSDNQYAQAYDKAFSDIAQKESSVAQSLGGPDKAVAGNQGYVAYVSVMALKEAMLASKFTGKADTEKLISALENLKATKGPDFPAGDMVMSKTDHQGRLTEFLVKVDGQKQDVLQTVPPDQVPSIGTCKI